LNFVICEYFSYFITCYVIFFLNIDEWLYSEIIWIDRYFFRCGYICSISLINKLWEIHSFHLSGKEIPK
jgi:hypothetical protein